MAMTMQNTPVKNTFVHFDDQQDYVEQEEPCVTRRRTKRLATAPALARTFEDAFELEFSDCSTSFRSLGSALYMDEDDSSDDSLNSASFVPRGINDDVFDAIASTPTASECIARFSLERGVPALEARVAVKDAAPSQSVKEEVAKVPAQQVLVNVPISVPRGMAADAFANRLQIAIESLVQSSFNEAGDSFVDVKMRLSGVPPVPVPLLLAQAVPATEADSASGKPATAVCCHWKQKGWCAYKNTCKFLHPEHKRGVGAGKGPRPKKQARSLA